VIDSTYKVEYGSIRNYVCDEWEIIGAAVGICKAAAAETAGEAASFVPLTFGGSRRKYVAPGEFFTSDPVELSVAKGDFLCVEVEFRGEAIPYHLESIVPTFIYENGKWVPDKRVPVPGMVGCDRRVKARIGYFGDSITQGIGTPPNAYTHWCALAAEALGENYSHWNLGIGYGRCQDAASNGAWMFKARHVDGAVVTFGSNDVGRGRSVEEMKRDFTDLVELLHGAGVKVFLQTLPPFDWKDDFYGRWRAINEFLKNDLAPQVEGFFDVAPLLTDETRGPGMSKYGKHPDETGCRIWADALIPRLKEFATQITKER
jgi:lysophospholipase L1-like esterase